MNIIRLSLRFLNISKIFAYICSRKRFSASELEKKFEVSHTTIYRYLNIWCDERYIEKLKYRGANHNGVYNEFKITQKGFLLFTEIRDNILRAFETNNIENLKI